MQVVTSQEFYANNAKYFELADKEIIVVTRQNARPIILNVAEDDRIIMTPELQARIDKAETEIEAGHCVVFNSHEEIDRYFESL